MKARDRVVVASSGEHGEVVGVEKVMGEPDGPFEETLVHVHLDGYPPGWDVGIGQHALVAERDYPDWEPDPEMGAPAG